MGRTERQEKTLKAMVRLYCVRHHQGPDPLCLSCQELYDYALTRLRACRFHPNKPVCSKCPSPCYKPEMRSRIIEVMKYSGPRMLFTHPVLALSYLKDKLTN